MKIESIRQWLIGEYMSDPTPSTYTLGKGEEPEKLVLVSFVALAAFVRGQGLDVLSACRECDRRGWIRNMMIDVRAGKGGIPYGADRLNLPLGRHRIIGIRAGVMESVYEGTPEVETLNAQLFDKLAVATDAIGMQIVQIAKDDSMSREQRLGAIYRLDNRMIGKTADEMAKLLDCTAANVRGMATWKRRYAEFG